MTNVILFININRKSLVIEFTKLQQDKNQDLLYDNQDSMVSAKE